jgi:hypothetical protein
MRLWSIHPKYLDKQGLTGLWREALLARKVLEGKTKGYKNHPQLIRFRAQTKPLEAINAFLHEVYKESLQRGYKFDKSKLSSKVNPTHIKVTNGQLAFETNHLKNKLTLRDKPRFEAIKERKTLPVNPLFKRVAGDVESWERV